MQVQELDRDQWVGYMSALASEAVLCTVHLTGESSRSQPGMWRALRAIDFDRERDVVVLSVGGGAPSQPALRFFVSAPRRITLAHEDASTAMIIVDGSGVETVIRFATARPQAVAI